MQKSSTLAASEANKKSRLEMDIPTQDVSKFLAPNTSLNNQPIPVLGDYYAVVPYAPSSQSKHGIYVAIDQKPDTGLVVGIPSNSELAIGDVVKFEGKPVAELTGNYPAYGELAIYVFRLPNLIAKL